MDNIKDIIIIGGGPGGYVAGIRAAQLGAKVCVIEKDRVGGTCLNRGCIPTKTLYRTAELLNNLKHIEDFGIKVDNYEVNVEKIQNRKSEIVNTLVGGIEKLIEGNGVEFIRGEASFIASNTISVITKEGEIILKGKNIIIASGSKSEIPSIEGINNPKVITSDELLDFDHIPKTLAVIGGGVIGMEFASIFNALGSSVTVIVARDSILYDVDREITKRYTAMAKRTGIQIQTSTVVKSISGEGEVIIKCDSKKGEVEIKADMVLVAKGRIANFDGLNLDKIGVDFDRKKIKVDENYETSIKGIYAIGDVNGICQLAHAASHQGVQVVEKILLNKDIHNPSIPNCIFTFPEIATVGITEEEAKEKGIPYKKSKFLFGANGKALALGEGEGFVKAICNSEDNTLLGIHIMGPHASDLIHEGVLAIDKKMKAYDIKDIVHSHPTLGEAFYEAILALNGEAIHSINK